MYIDSNGIDYCNLNVRSKCYNKGCENDEVNHFRQLELATRKFRDASCNERDCFSNGKELYVGVIGARMRVAHVEASCSAVLQSTADISAACEKIRYLISWASSTKLPHYRISVSLKADTTSASLACCRKTYHTLLLLLSSGIVFVSRFLSQLVDGALLPRALVRVPTTFTYVVQPWLVHAVSVGNV